MRWKLGAFYSLFDDKVAELLGIQLEQGKRLLAVVGDGSFIPFYLFDRYRVTFDNQAKRVSFERG